MDILSDLLCILLTNSLPYEVPSSQLLRNADKDASWYVCLEVIERSVSDRVQDQTR